MSRIGRRIVTPLKPEHRSGIICFKDPCPSRTVAKLDRAGISVSGRYGAVRVSPHCYNTNEEIEKFLEVMEKFGYTIEKQIAERQPMAISWFDIELVVLVYVIVFLIIGISEYCRRRLNLGPLTTRHAIHLFAGMALFFLPFFSEWYYPFLIPLGIGAVTVTAFMFKKRSFITTSMVDEKKYSRAHAFGPVYYIVSIGVLVALAWNFRHIVIASIMIMAWETVEQQLLLLY